MSPNFGTHFLVRQAAQIVASDATDDQSAERAVRELFTDPESVKVIEGLLEGTQSNVDPFTLLYLLGQSGREDAANVVHHFASRPIADPTKLGAIEFERQEVARRGAFAALRELGAIERLEALYQTAPAHVRNSIRVELHALDSVKWPMYVLPQAFFDDLRYDEKYVEAIDGALVEVESFDSHEDSTLFLVPPAPQVLVSDTEKDLLAFKSRQWVQATNAAPALACDTTSTTRAPTSSEIFAAGSLPWCDNSLIASYWNGYSFNRSWNSAMGYDEPCNLNLPLARAFNSIHLLHTAAPDAPTTYSDFSGSFLRWAGNYARREIPSFRASCATSYFGVANWAALKKNRHVTITQAAFYERSTAARASTIVHEARHTERCRHNGNDGSNACPARSESCDESWTDGCTGVGSPSGAGAVGWQVRWLQLYLSSAKPSAVNSFNRNQAQATANNYLDNMFDVHPGFNLSLYGAALSN